MSNIYYGSMNALYETKSDVLPEQSWLIFLCSNAYGGYWSDTELFYPRQYHHLVERDVPLGQYTFDEIQSGAVSLEELRDEAERVNGGKAWEQLGSTLLSLEFRIDKPYATRSSDLVAGLYLAFWKNPRKWFPRQHGIFLMWDGPRFVEVGSEQNPSQEYLDLIAADRRVRADLGLTPPPDYAALISEYVERMENN